MGLGAPEIAVPHAGETLWRALYARLVGEVVPLADLLSTHFGDDVVVGEAAAPAAMRILLMERSARREADERAAEVPGLRLRLAQAEDSATQAEAAWGAEHSLRLAAEKAREEAEMRLALKRREYDIEVEVHAATKRERDSYIKGYEAAESRAARLADALENIEEETTDAFAAGIARAALAAEEGR